MSYGETLQIAQDRTERKVRIALRTRHNQTALDWTADEIIGKNNQNTNKLTGE